MILLYWTHDIIPRNDNQARQYATNSLDIFDQATVAGGFGSPGDIAVTIG
jgi:hypothetical protein